VCHQQYNPPRRVSPTIQPSPSCVTNNTTLPVVCHQQYNPPRRVSLTIPSSPSCVTNNTTLPACVTNNTSSPPCVTNNTILPTVCHQQYHYPRRVSSTIPPLLSCVTNNTALTTVCHQQYHAPRRVSPTIPPSPPRVTNNTTIDVKCAICWIVDVNFVENAMFLCHKGKAVQSDIYIVGIYRDLKHFVQWLLPVLVVSWSWNIFICVCVEAPKDIFYRSKQQVSNIWEIFVSFTVTLTIISNIMYKLCFIYL